MNSKKPIVITAVVTFFVTTAFYLTPLGTTVVNVMNGSFGKQDIHNKLDIISKVLEKSYIYDYDKQTMEDMALAGYLAGAGDEYTQYMSKSVYNNFMQGLGANYKGVGIRVNMSEDTGMLVERVEANSPAEKAGIISKDVIVKVEGEEVTIENYDKLINIIKGVDAPEGDNDVTVTVKRGEQIFDVTMVREIVNASTVTSKMLAGSVGYMQISDFGEKTYDEFSEHLSKLKDNNIKGLVIDLRNNPGGMFTTVVDIADVLLPKANILTVKYKNGDEEKYDSDEQCIDLPISIIINGSSASASEVLAGALKDNKKAVLVGEKSFGKGVVQSLYTFKDGSAFKFTSARYYTPSGKCIDKIGIEPDVEIKLDEKYENTAISLIPENEDAQLNAALAQVSKKIK